MVMSVTSSQKTLLTAGEVITSMHCRLDESSRQNEEKDVHICLSFVKNDNLGRVSLEDDCVTNYKEIL